MKQQQEASLDWYVVAAWQGQEREAIRSLRDQRFADVYSPRTFEREKTARGRVKPFGSPLLSPYIFVLMDISRGEHSVLRNARGVERLLCDASGKPDKMRGGASYIARLRQAEDDEFFGALQTHRGGRTDLKRGQIVRIVKDGMLTRNSSGEAVQVVGPITLIHRRRVEIQIGICTWAVDEDDVVIV